MTILEMEGILHDLIGACLDYLTNTSEDNFYDLRDVAILASAELIKHRLEQDQYNSEEERDASRH
jgi:hypothetical protein